MAYIANDPRNYQGKSVGNGHCVAFARAAAGMPHTSLWQKGSTVFRDMTIKPGTAIATFNSEDRYGNKTDGTSHVAIYLGQDAAGIQVLDQWRGHAVAERTIRYAKATRAVNDGRNYYVVD